MWIAQISDSHLCPRGTPYKGVVDSNRALAAAVVGMLTQDVPAGEFPGPFPFA